MIGIFIGIASVVSLIALGQGVRQAVIGQFDAMGKDKILISPGSQLLSSFTSSSYFTDRELSIIQRTGGVKQAAGLIYMTSSVKHGNEVKYTTVTGLPTEKNDIDFFKTMQNIQIQQGRYLQPGDTNKANVGSMFANPKDFFQKPVRIGDKIEINGREFEVVGIMAPIGNPSDDTSIAIPLDEARSLFGRKDQLDMIIAQANDAEEVDSVASAIKRNLRKYRGLQEGKEDFSVDTSKQLMDSFNVILNAVQFVILGIAAISLIVGGIGIMNTMYTSVLERTKDIGIMKAVGAKNSDILLIFLMEAGLLGLAGGAIGLGLGVLLAKLVENVAVVAMKTTLLKPQFSLLLIIGSLLFSFFVGVISGLFPARQAAKMKAAESIQFRL
ncbi:ABC transporter permease [Candidatus Woesearchaeota archaeon CG07_land_8_20_14_0_80_44_23]|nr:MAG: ABC transporter permease [Candidatus Woesearchaeota archaeon CG07_land_8_20_14_0_80_44_23]